MAVYPPLPYQKTKVYIIYLEDMREWHLIMDLLLTKLPDSLPYKLITVKTMEEAEKKINTISGPKILIADMDLRLAYERNRISSERWLSDNYSRFSEKGIEVFVLSGYLSEEKEEHLAYIGIKRDHIFDKMYFDEDWDESENEDFLTSIRRSLLKKSQLRKINEVPESSTQLFRFYAEFPDVYDSVFHLNKPYKLSISIEKELASAESIEFEVEVIAEEAIIVPSDSTIIELGREVSSATVEFWIKGASKGFNFVDVNFYHLNRWTGKISFRDLNVRS